MRPMTQNNLRNIRARFESHTGVSLRRRSFLSGRRLLVLAGAVICCLAMLAFSSPLFSSLDGDELSLTGTYEGGGIVSIRVENRSDKHLRFQPETRLIRWVTGQEVQHLGGRVVFENREFAPHSEGTMVLDISAAYDVAALEGAKAKESYYFLLTNNVFLHGQDWMCSVTFGTEPSAEPEAPAPSESVGVEPEVAGQILPELRFYFEKSYTDTLMAFNEANFQYQQKVEELIPRSESQVVSSLSPLLMVGGPSEFLEPEPVLGRIPEETVFDESLPREQQYLLTHTQWSHTDGFGRMVATFEEKAWVISAMLPESPGQTDGGTAMPLIFLLVYDAEEAAEENSAFVYGQILTFAQLEHYRVLEDAHYAVYNVTELIYQDLDAMVDAFRSVNPNIHWEESLRSRIRNIYDYHMESANIRALYGYLENPGHK